MKSNEVKKCKGFTLLELMFAVGLMIMLAAVSVPMTLGFFNEQVLDESAQALKNNIKTARSRAINGRGSGFWGVKIEEDKYILFEGESFEGRNRTNDRRIGLPGGMEFERPGREIVFERETGKPFYDSSLVGHWKLNAGEGCMAYDYSNFGNHGLLSPDCPTTSPDWVDDRDGNPGRALEFDGEDTYINTNNTFNRYLQEPSISLSVWVYFRDISDRHQGILNNEHAGTRIALIHGLIYFELETEDDRERVELDPDDANIQENEWTHLTYSADGNELHAYVNGEFVDSVEMEAEKGVLTDYPFVIGTRGDGLGDRIFDGFIDDARIYNRALSEDEIGSLYENNQGEITLSFQGNSVELQVDEQGNVSIH